MIMDKCTFSGHESFPCKALWLKKGYDFVFENNDWNELYSVVKLGVGKNMVSSIRYWMRAFGMLNNDGLTDIAHFIFSPNDGTDPFIEDLGTLWLLHYQLVCTGEATLYSLFFTRFQRERLTFDRTHVTAFVKRIMTENRMIKQFNENTVKKDVGVLLQNYLLSHKPSSMEDYSILLTDLDLIRLSSDEKQYSFNIDGKRQLPVEILLYAIVKEKGNTDNVDYDTLQLIGNVFCLSDMELVYMLMALEVKFPNTFRYTDTAGLRQVHLLKSLKPDEVLKHYYKNEEL